MVEVNNKLETTLVEQADVKAQNAEDGKNQEKIAYVRLHDLWEATEARAETAEAALAEARALLDYITQTDRNNDGYRIVDMCFTAFMAAKKPNTEDGGPSDWMEDTRPLVLEGLADIRRRAAFSTQENR